MAVFKASGLATMEGLQLTTLCSYLGLLNPFDETARTGTRFIRPEEIDVEPTPVSDVLTRYGKLRDAGGLRGGRFRGQAREMWDTGGGEYGVGEV